MGKYLNRILLATVIMMTTINLPQNAVSVYAKTAPTAPSSTFISNIDDGKGFKLSRDDFNGSYSLDGEKNEDGTLKHKEQVVYFGEYIGNNSGAQTWYIAGKNDDGTLVLMCDPARPFKAAQKFLSSDKYEQKASDSKYYNKSTYDSKEVYANHYGASDLRAYLTGEALNKFTSQEKELMAGTSIYTNDMKSNNKYELNDKLYAAYGGNLSNYITVGNNSPENLHNGLKIALNGSGKYTAEKTFWLRSPYSNTNEALLCYPVRLGGRAENQPIWSDYAATPAFHLNMTSVLFASAAKTATDNASMDSNNVMTFRYDSAKDASGNAVSDRISTVAKWAPEGITVETPGHGQFLYVQWKDGDTEKVYSIRVTDITGGTLSAVSIGGAGFTLNSDCKIWVEIPDFAAHLVYAKMVEGHTHSWVYGTKTSKTTNDTLVAYCNADGCKSSHTSFETGATLTIKAPSQIAEGKAVSVPYGTADEQTEWTRVGLSLPTELVVKKDGNTVTNTDLQAGSYSVEVSIGTDDNKATATSTFNVIEGEGGFSSFLEVGAFYCNDFNSSYHIRSDEGRQVVYFGKDDQTWYIAGMNDDGTLVLMCDREKPLKTKQQFKSSTDDGTYNGAKVYANHYGSSDLRAYLTGEALNKFTSEEQRLMADTNIYTYDMKNNTTYLLNDKLYAVYGDKTKYDNKIIAGNNYEDSLCSGILIYTDDVGRYKPEGGIWLRAHGSENDRALRTDSDGTVNISEVNQEYDVFPAFHLDLSSLLFASTATAATADATLGSGEGKENENPMAFRFDGSEKIKSNVLLCKDRIVVSKSAEDSTLYLYVHGDFNGSEDVYSKEITKDEIISAEDIKELKPLSDIDLSNYHIWIEKKEDNITYAKMDVVSNNHNFVDQGDGTHKCINCATSEPHDFIKENGSSDLSKEECSLCGVKNINYEGLDDKVVSKDIEYTGSPVSPDVTITGLTKGTDYTVEDASETELGIHSVSVNGIGIYTGTRNASWKIVAGAPSLTLPIVEASLKQKLGDLTITNPEGNIRGTWSFKNPDVVLNAKGNSTHKATFIPEDTTHWYAVEKDLTVVVGKAVYTPASDYSKSYSYSNSYTGESLNLIQFVPDDAGNAEFAVSDISYSVRNTVSNVSIDGNNIKYSVLKMDNYADNTSTTISVTISTDNYKDYVQKINITRSRCEHPADMIVTEHVKPATCEEDGIDQKRCTKCGEIVESGIVVDALTHHYVDGICDREGCGVISLKLYEDVEVKADDVKYDGELHTPIVTVTVNGKVLINESDYTVSVEPKKEVGTYDLSVTGIGKYRDDVSVIWSVYSAEGLWYEGIPDQVYTGKAITPETDIYYNGVLLTKGKEYTLTYSNNIKAADKTAMKNNKSIAPSVTITGKGNYAGKKTVHFSIVPKSIEKADIDVATITVVKSNRASKVNPVVRIDGLKLKAGKDYVISKSINPSDAVTEIGETGKHTLYVVGKNNYGGAVPFIFNVTADTLAGKVTIDRIANQTYTGNEIKPEVGITYKNKTNVVTDKFDITFKDNKEIGTATVIVTAKDGSGFAGSKKVTFKITGTSITGAKPGADGRGKIADETYNGVAHTPALDLYDGATALVKGRDYTVAYSNNVNAGNAVATVKGKGRYTGTKKFSFKINKYDASKDESNAIKINNCVAISEAYVKGGTTPKPVISMNGIILTEKKDYTLSYSNNKAVAGIDSEKAPTVTINFKGNLSGKKPVKFTITKKDISACSIFLADMPASTAENKWKQTKATITDTNGKALKAGADFENTITYYSDSTCTSEITAATLNAGTTVYVKIKGINSYDGSEIKGSYYISNTNITSANVSIADYTFTRSEICPTADMITVTVKNGADKKKLTAETDYEIVAGSYKNNINKGTATVTIRGKGDYFGTKVVKFNILQQTIEK